VVQHLTVARVADGLGVSWNTANDAALAEGRRVLIDGPGRFHGVAVVGVDEHAWRHTRRGDKYVTVIIDLTAVRAGTGPARLLDMVEGRSKQVFRTWLAGRPQAWRDRIEVVAMDGFTGSRPQLLKSFPTRSRSWTRSTWRAWPATHWTCADDAYNRPDTGTAAARATRSATPAGPCTPEPARPTS
jgi:transposase